MSDNDRQITTKLIMETTSTSNATTYTARKLRQKEFFFGKKYRCSKFKKTLV
uniref:Uncharacterized protein n=1 Tax=Arundo donax TaxID=35708 RepID=A0A0A9F5J2_ARUDO